MAKIVVLADGEDATAASAALDAASIDYQIVKPDPAKILHLVIGMVGSGGGSDKDDEEKEEKEPKEEPTSEEPPDDSDIASDASAVEESLGFITLNGELVEAFKTADGTSFLNVADLVVGPKTSYRLNESTFSFWPASVSHPSQRVLIEHAGKSTSVEVPVRKSNTKTSSVSIGADLAELFATK